MACAKQPAEDLEQEEYKTLLVGQLKQVSEREHGRLKEAQEALATQVATLKKEGVIAEAMLRDESESKALWQITFGRTDRADWCMTCPEEGYMGVRLAQPSTSASTEEWQEDGGSRSSSSGKPPKVLQPLEDEESGELLRDPRELMEGELDMTQVMFKRFRHGKGKERRARFVIPDPEEGEEDESEEDSEEDEEAARKR